MAGAEKELSADLFAKAARASVVDEVRSVLGTNRMQTDAIVEAFETFVAEPLERNLQRLRGRDLARRNPMIYTLRGVDRIDDWVDRVLEDKETSAIESHIGTFLEEVAGIVSGGIKPGSGVDLQVDGEDGVIQLYALQSSGNTKNAGSRRSDIDALKRAALPLRAARRHVELNFAVLHGRSSSGTIKAEPGITVLGSDIFWTRVSGVADFRVRMLKASLVLARLVQGRAADQVDRIRDEARQLFGTDAGELDLEALANPGALEETKEAPEAAKALNPFED
jgi:hypothetical protein